MPHGVSQERRVNRLLAAGLLAFALAPRVAGAQALMNPVTEKKIDALLAQMTIDEKVGQLNQYSSPFDVTGPPPSGGAQKLAYDQIRQGLVGSMLNVTGAEATRRAQQLAVENSRLKIPLIFGFDVIHGYKTIFPVPLAEAASWDPAAVEQSARIAATEAAAAGLHWTFGPMVDIARDTRWGRVMEGSGEDAYLGAEMAAARVRGFQGKSLAAVDTIAACAKHYAAYGFAEGGGESNSAVSLLEGVKAAVSPGTRVIYAEGAKLVTGPRNFGAPSVFNTSDRSGFPAAVEAARSADVVVLAIGEDAFQSGEGRSVADLGLKGLQDELLRAVVEANKKVVVVLMAGRPLTIGHVAAAVPALVEGWLLGSQSGHAIADVLFGEYNPSGKLPASFPQVVGQEPLYYGRKNTGRPGPEPGVTWSHYTDVSNDPLYPFGFGLSYTGFTYSDPRLSATEIGRDGQLQVSVTVTNSGQRAGTEIAQLYVRELVGSVTRPIKELKGFQRVELAPGQARELTFAIKPADLAFYTARGQWEAEP